MDAVLRGLAIYVFLIVVFRLSGKRSVGDITAFDFVLLLIVAETTQQALLGNDFSITKCYILVVTLVGADIALSLVKRRFPRIDRILDDTPLVVVVDGRPLKERMDRERVDEQDVLEAARRLHGLERMDQIKYAVLERNGGLSVVPRPGA